MLEKFRMRESRLYNNIEKSIIGLWNYVCNYGEDWRKDEEVQRLTSNNVWSNSGHSIKLKHAIHKEKHLPLIGWERHLQKLKINNSCKKFKTRKTQSYTVKIIVKNRIIHPFSLTFWNGAITSSSMWKWTANTSYCCWHSTTWNSLIRNGIQFYFLFHIHQPSFLFISSEFNQ